MADTPYSEIRYNQVRQKSSHNSFQRDEGIYDQMLYLSVSRWDQRRAGRRCRPIRGRALLGHPSERDGATGSSA
jgi:hypothetical protein